MNRIIASLAIVAATAGAAAAAVPGSLATSLAQEASLYGVNVDAASLTTAEVTQLQFALTSNDSASDTRRAILSAVN
ncbi:hypothetical protein [Brevirhabdus sp.]|uniref:hypothetical protein n=1 Tax=Brevirhabdus sp. TaxID=2004514 RepID=UPI004059770E